MSRQLLTTALAISLLACSVDSPEAADTATTNDGSIVVSDAADPSQAATAPAVAASGPVQGQCTADGKDYALVDGVAWPVDFDDGDPASHAWNLTFSSHRLDQAKLARRPSDERYIEVFDQLAGIEGAAKLQLNLLVEDALTAADIDALKAEAGADASLLGALHPRDAGSRIIAVNAWTASGDSMSTSGGSLGELVLDATPGTRVSGHFAFTDQHAHVPCTVRFDLPVLADLAADAARQR